LWDRHPAQPKTPSYTPFDATVAYETPDWRRQLSAQNLEDKYYVVSCTADRGDCGIGQGRTIITRFTYKF
jgi:iron complex outermembrane recepter protein